MKLRRTLLTAGLIMALSAGAAFAAEPANTNPWGLVYRNAITQNVKGQVNITRQKNTPLLLLPTPTAALKNRLQGCTPSALPHSATSPSRLTLLIRAQAKANRATPTSPFTAPKTFTAWPITL